MAQLWSCRLLAGGKQAPVGSSVVVTTQYLSQQPNIAQIEDACEEQLGVKIKNLSITQWDISPL